MMKNNKLKLIISTIVILLPILVGLILWDKLPEQVPTHWGADGNPDGWSSKPFAVFGMPCILLLLHGVCIIATSRDKKNAGQNLKLMGLTYWLVPVISIAANGMVYATSIGKDVDIMLFLPIFMGVLFLFIGNYIPKCTQSRTVGIKIKWTLADEENWNATHRFAGKIWVIGSVIILASALLPANISVWVMIGVTFLMAIVPMVYSYCFYRKKKGKIDE